MDVKKWMYKNRCIKIDHIREITNIKMAKIIGLS